MEINLIIIYEFFDNAADELVSFAAQLMGFPNYIPPYSRVRGRALLQGANYASGAAGIRDETGNNLVFCE